MTRGEYAHSEGHATVRSETRPNPFSSSPFSFLAQPIAVIFFARIDVGKADKYFHS
jgi:hypothetical protein